MSNYRNDSTQTTQNQDAGLNLPKLYAEVQVPVVVTHGDSAQSKHGNKQISESVNCIGKVSKVQTYEMLKIGVEIDLTFEDIKRMIDQLASEIRQ